MHPRHFGFFHAVVCAILILPAANRAALSADTDDEQTLKAAHLAADGPALVEYLRKMTATASNRDKIKELVRQLGDDTFAVREKASAELVALGKTARPFLREALKDADPEIARLAKKCLQLIEQKNTLASPPAAAIRLLALKKPAGAIEALLDYLPFAEDDGVAEEVRTSLVSLALRDGKPDPILTGALADKEPIRRAAAAETLCRADAADQRPALLSLLKDPDATVRLRVALALAQSKEKEAVPVLIELLAQLPPEQSWEAEEALVRLAGERAPAGSLIGDEAGRRKYRDAWAAWWREHGAAADLAKMQQTPPLLGHTLLASLGHGEVMELDKDNKPRFRIGGLAFPLDVRLLPGDRVLICEHDGNRVTERNFKGEVVWGKNIGGPMTARRLPNGNTFIATHDEVVEVDPQGKEVFKHVPPAGSTIMSAIRLRNGSFALIFELAGNHKQVFRLHDPAGKQMRDFSVSGCTDHAGIEMLPNGHLLLPQTHEDRIVEYDAAGEAVRSYAVAEPISVVRLPNGNILVTSLGKSRAVEIDRRGKEVWELKFDAEVNVTRVLRR